MNLYGLGIYKITWFPESRCFKNNYIFERTRHELDVVKYTPATTQTEENYAVYVIHKDNISAYTKGSNLIMNEFLRDYSYATKNTNS